MVQISEDFTPVASLAGGALIGAAASLNLALNGRTTGLSGILSGALKGSEGLQWRVMVLSGLGVAAAATQVLAPQAFGVATKEDQGQGLLLPLVAGLLVGFGTQLGNGCTSGHGICGLAFLSPRSLVAVATFMATAMATSIAAAHTNSFGLQPLLPLPLSSIPFFPALVGTVSLLAAVTIPTECFSQRVADDTVAQPLLSGATVSSTTSSSSSQAKEPCSSLVASLATGLIFGSGLAISGMLNPHKVINFLNVTGTWDPSLLLVMGGGVAVTGTAFRFILRRPQPLLLARWSHPTRRDLTSDLVLGAATFGVGWGLGGICPGPGFMSLATGNVSRIVWGVGLVLGFAAFSQFDMARKRWARHG